MVQTKQARAWNAAELLLSSDVAKLLDMTPAAVRAAATQGRLETAGRTRGGVRYFTLRAVEAFQLQRESRVRRFRSRGDV
jgi:DNA-binding transcriptional MerR regulator